MGQWATNSTHVPNTANGLMYCQINTWLISQDIANNTSTIGWSVAVKGNLNYSKIYWDKSYAKLWIAGSIVYNREAGKTFILGEYHSGQHVIHHNDEGTGGYMMGFISGMYPGEPRDIGDTWNTLPTIPRKATFNWTGDVLDTTQNIYFSYNNPAGNSVESLQFAVRLDDDPNASLPWRDVPKTGKEFWYKLSDENIVFLRSKMGSRKTTRLIYYLKTRIGGRDNYEKRDSTFTLTNASAPIFTSSNVDISEYNPTVKDLSLKANTFVQNQSKLKIVITDAQAKDTEIKKYIIKLGNKIVTTYTTAGTKILNPIDFAGKAKLKVIAEDARGAQTEVSRDVTFIEWVKPSAVIKINRVNNYEDDTKLKVDASFSSVNGKNTLEIFYKKKKVNTSYFSDRVKISNYQEATMFNDKQFAWDVVVILKDKFTEIEYPLNVPLGRFILFIDTKKLSVGINCFPKRTETLEVGGKRVVTENELTPWKDGKKRILLYSKVIESYREFTNIQSLYEPLLESNGWCFLDGTRDLSALKNSIDSSKYKIELALECLISTTGNFYGLLGINDIKHTVPKRTWGPLDLMTLSPQEGNFFSPDDISFNALESTTNYDGIQIIAHADKANGGSIRFKNVTMHVYAVEK